MASTGEKANNANANPCSKRQSENTKNQNNMESVPASYVNERA